MSYDIRKLLHQTPTIIYQPVGTCIYCGSKEDLSDEHIMPLALNGTMLLPKSSCKKCAEITSKFELNVTRKMYGNLRIKLGYNSRRKKARPSRLPVKFLTENGKQQELDFDIADYPNISPVVYMPSPGILTGAPLTDTNPEIRIALKGNQDEISNALNSIGGIRNASILTNHYFPYGDFCRLLAKIAHGFLVANYGLKGYEPFLPNLILGQSPYLSHYVGCLNGGKGSMTMLAHHGSLEILPIGDNIYLTVNIHLLSGIEMPTYQVIAGQLQ